MDIIHAPMDDRADVLIRALGLQPHPEDSPVLAGKIGQSHPAAAEFV